MGGTSQTTRPLPRPLKDLLCWSFPFNKVTSHWTSSWHGLLWEGFDDIHRIKKLPREIFFVIRFFKIEDGLCCGHCRWYSYYRVLRHVLACWTNLSFIIPPCVIQVRIISQARLENILMRVILDPSVMYQPSWYQKFLENWLWGLINHCTTFLELTDFKSPL